MVEKQKMENGLNCVFPDTTITKGYRVGQIDICFRLTDIEEYEKLEAMLNTGIVFNVLMYYDNGKPREIKNFNLEKNKNPKTIY